MPDLKIQFQVECRETKPGESIYIVGNSSELGNWKAENAIKLKTNKDKFPLWESEPISFQSNSQLEYKYIINSSSNNVKWEKFKGNRILNLSSLENNLYFVNDGKFSNNSNQRISQSNESSTPSQTYQASYNNEYSNPIRNESKNLDYYIREWLDGKANGKGKFVNINGATYEGEWKNDKQDGQGREIWPNGSEYRGAYSNGQKNGFGEFKWGNGSVYIGNFVNNDINGRGKYIFSDKRVYEGMWENNKMNGLGKFEWPDGKVFEGEYLNDKKNGFGIFNWPDGRIYKGMWKNGKQHEEKDYSKINFNKILITDSKDINKSKKEGPFPFKIPPTGPFLRSDIKNSSESSGGNNSLGKITPDFRMNPPFMPSNDKFYLLTNPQNIPHNRNMFFNSNPKMVRFVGGVENNNNNNKISTDSNSIHSYSINNQSMLSANSAFKKSSSGSGSGSGRSFQQRVGVFNFNNMADLNKEYFSNITLEEKNLNNKM